MGDLRVKIIRLLLHWLIHNGSLPSAVMVNPLWARSVQVFLDDLELEVAVRGDFGMNNGDVRLVV